jgi:hypothetical protein
LLNKSIIYTLDAFSKLQSRNRRSPLGKPPSDRFFKSFSQKPFQNQREMRLGKSHYLCIVDYPRFVNIM